MRAAGAPELDPERGAVGEEGVSGLRIRRMTEADLGAVVGLEEAAFSSPWKEETFRSLLTRPGAELWIAEEEGPGTMALPVVGYAVLWCILDEGELANIAIREDRRRRGYGAALLDRILQVARKRGVRTVWLEVRFSNRAAADLYRSRGFEEVSIRRDYYRDPTEDARVLALRWGDFDPHSG